jgi:hypothetical protein
MTKHGHSTPDKTREYRSWQSMKARCYYPGNPEYPSYGDLGVTVCEQWRDDFSAFLADVGPRPPNTSLDRYPNPWGRYQRGNTRWATLSEQQRNRRDRVKPRICDTLDWYGWTLRRKNPQENRTFNFDLVARCR